MSIANPTAGPRAAPDEPSPVDEVRAIRREIVAMHGNDVVMLCEHLRDVEREFLTRTGRFASVPRPSQTPVPVEG